MMPRTHRHGCVPLAILASATLVFAVGANAQPPDTSTRAVVAAAAAYVKAYQNQLTSVIADETYTQRIIDQVPRDPEIPPARTLTSEIFFMVAGDGWMTIRDVMAVDGRAREDRPVLEEELKRLPPTQVADSFKTYNSRFNLGRTFRNFNEPTLSLLVLDDEHRSRFSFDRTTLVVRAGGRPIVVLSFTEKQRPTLIRDVTYGPVYSKGELDIEAGSGTIRRARLTASVGPMRVELTTTYEPDERLGIWVPVSFREHYLAGRRRGSLTEREEIVCEATYDNYRRFETSIRIKGAHRRR